MKQMQFVACSATSCPFNEMKSCRASFIAIDKDGSCMIFSGGPFTQKSETERHVEIRSCECESCAHFERDEITQRGTCGYNEPLFFSKELANGGDPICSTFGKQIDAPPYATKI